MTANTLPATGMTLGGFLRDRRARLAPASAALSRRRTPGLRREEVAARADVSVTWYTWLEQGRGGPPSDDVLERLSGALELDAAGREILFLLAQQRPPPLKPATCAPIAPALQRVLDSLSPSPAFLRTPAWDVLAWNDAATAVLANYAELPFRDRNGLRRLFCDPDVRATLPDWEDNARFVVAVFRVEVARSGSSPEAVALADELHARSADFRRFWAENDVRSHGVGLKRIVHRTAGMLHFEFSAFSVDGGDGLSMIVYTPARPADVRAVEALLASRTRYPPPS
jgi:transcriptional regulator with XRE-family HTH domain